MDYENQISVLEGRKSELKENIRTENEKINKERQILNLHKFLVKCDIRTWTKELERTIILTLVKSIKIKPDSIEVCYYLPLDPLEDINQSHDGDDNNT
jgi:hypothetical protein